MSVTGSTGSFGLLINFESGALTALHLELLWLCTWSILLKLLLMVTVPVFLYIFYKWGSFVPIHISLLLVLLLHWGLVCSWVCGSIFMWGFEVVVVVGGIGQSFLKSKRFPDIFPALGHGVPAQGGIILSGGGLLSTVPSCEGFWISEFVGALGVVKGGCVVALLVLDLGLASTFTLYFFVGWVFSFSLVLLFLFSYGGWYQLGQV